jgi:hypothetical protein
VPIALFCAWALLPAAILFVGVGDGLALGSGGRAFLGPDQINVPDQLQYLAWIRDAGDHVLFSNRFDLAPDPHLFLHPLWALSGLAWKLGASLQLSFLVWRPIAVATILIGFVAYARRLIPQDGWGRSAALVLALFSFPPAAALWEWLDLGERLTLQTTIMGIELFPGGWTAIGIVAGLMPLFLLAVERVADPSRRPAGRSAAPYAAGAAVAGALVSWIHPWQGLTLLGIVAGAVAWSRRWELTRALAVPVAGLLAPYPYYWLLSHSESAWHTAAQPQGYPHWGWWLALTMLPPLLLAAPGLPGRGLDLQERMLRLWPLAAALVYFGLDRSWFYHAVMGLSLPLAILAVRGLRRVAVPRAAIAAAVALLTVPGCAYFVQLFREEAAAHFVERGEMSALRHLDRREGPGGVLAREPLATAVPGFSGRKTWTGHPTWTPDWATRRARAQALFDGTLPADRAGALVEEAGARWLLVDCRARGDLPRLLGGRVASTRRFGCASVIELRRR